MTKLEERLQRFAWNDDAEVGRLALRSSFMRPEYLAQSAWIEHIPFAFWAIEALSPGVFVELGTHLGASYFAFCQAVDRLGLTTRCYAVDTWQGDAHAGYYGPEVFETVNAYNAAHYSHFSSLVTSSFSEALEHFSEGSVDLLHIDGQHTLASVTEDFESWRSKLSDRAVVLLHDCNVRERGFGVYQLVEELKRTHPCFEFVHGHGLAVIGVGPEQTDRLERLYAAEYCPPAQRAIQEYFSRLGGACADTYAAQERLELVQEQRAIIGKRDEELAELRRLLDDTGPKKGRRCDDAENGLHAAAGGQTPTPAGDSVPVSSLQGQLDGLRAEVRRLGDCLARSSEELEERAEAPLGSPVAAWERPSRSDLCASETERFAAEREAVTNRLDDAHRSTETLLQERDEYLQRIGERDAELRGVRRAAEEERERLEQELGGLRANVKRRFEEIATLTVLLRGAESRTAELMAALAESEAERERQTEILQEQVSALNSRVSDATEHARRAEAEVQALEQRSRGLEGEIGRLTSSGRELEIEAEEQRRALMRQVGQLVLEMTGFSPEPRVDKRALRRAVSALEKARVVDRAWYTERYPDIAAAEIDPIEHYLIHGAREGRVPSPWFCPDEMPGKEGA